MREILLFLLLTLIAACGDPGTNVDLNGAEVVYSGEPNAQMVLIAEEVKECMQSDRADLPLVKVVSGNFKCRTENGWVDTWGCYSNDVVTLSLPYLLDTNGQSWAHELTHFYGDKNEHNDCGNVWFGGFIFP